jgi:hypothetical protein
MRGHDTGREHRKERGRCVAGSSRSWSWASCSSPCQQRRRATRARPVPSFRQARRRSGGSATWPRRCPTGVYSGLRPATFIGKHVEARLGQRPVENTGDVLEVDELPSPGVSELTSKFREADDVHGHRLRKTPYRVDEAAGVIGDDNDAGHAIRVPDVADHVRVDVRADYLGLREHPIPDATFTKTAASMSSPGCLWPEPPRHRPHIRAVA